MPFAGYLWTPILIPARLPFPLAHILYILWQITYSVPYAMISARIEALGLGQGRFLNIVDASIFSSYLIFYFCNSLCFHLLFFFFAGLSMGVLNLAIVMPQVSFIYCFIYCTDVCICINVSLVKTFPSLFISHWIHRMCCLF